MVSSGVFSPLLERDTPDTSDHSPDEKDGSVSPQAPSVSMAVATEMTLAGVMAVTGLPIAQVVSQLDLPIRGTWRDAVLVYFAGEALPQLDPIPTEDELMNFQSLRSKFPEWSERELEACVVLAGGDSPSEDWIRHLGQKYMSWKVFDVLAHVGRVSPSGLAQAKTFESTLEAFKAIKFGQLLPEGQKTKKVGWKTKLQPLLPSPGGSEMNYEEELDDRILDIKDIVNNDLTHNALVETFSDIPTHFVVQYIRKHYPNVPFTHGEKETLKLFLARDGGEAPLSEEVLAYLPLRSREQVEIKYKEFSFIAVRPKHFKNSTEKLVYEAQWSMFTGDVDSSRASRRARRERSVSQNEPPQKRPKRQLTEQELERRKHLLLMRRQAKERELEERKRLLQAKRERTDHAPTPKRPVKKVDWGLLACAKHFQSTIGDKEEVTEGKKRARVPVSQWEPDSRATHGARQRQKERQRLAAAMDGDEDTNAEIQTEPVATKRKVKREPSEVKAKSPVVQEFAQEICPYDPPDIGSDTLMNISGRKVFVPEIYADQLLPKLAFNDTKHGLEAMMSTDEDIPINDDSAVSICMSHTRNYREPPPGFPPFFGPNGEAGVSPAIKVRFLLYPQHYESFKLCVPKSNELDPVYEIVRLMQIHYGLYFNHSDYIRYEIGKYCSQLDDAFDQSDFGQFLFIVEKWNRLMLELSPNRDAVEELRKGGKDDINRELRVQFLAECEQKVPQLEDLRLEMWVSEIMEEPISPAYFPVKTTSVKVEGDEMDEPLVEDAPKYNIPTTLWQQMYHRLRTLPHWSRYAAQQILLRVYSRVVSTNSRKLRAYKSFTAEVYGELLPSFTSEVLEKVGLSPRQKFYDLGSGVGNTTLQAALEFGAKASGGCELMEHASKLTEMQVAMLRRHLAVFGLEIPELNWALAQSFVDNDSVRNACNECDVFIINNYLFDVNLNAEVGRLLRDCRPGTKIISLRNFIGPRYRASGDSVFDKLKVEQHEMGYEMSVSWTASKVPYYVSTVQEHILPQYLGTSE